MSVSRTLCAVLFAIAGAACKSRTHEAVQITQARSMSTPPGATVAAAYMIIQSRDADVLLGADTPVAGRVEMHVTEQRDGMMSMRPLPEVALGASGRFEFAPGGAHFMLMELPAPLEAGASFPMTLHFKSAGNVTTTVSVVAPGGTPNR
jgi:periplasmic copper chaperone A